MKNTLSALPGFYPPLAIVIIVREKFGQDANLASEEFIVVPAQSNNGCAWVKFTQVASSYFSSLLALASDAQLGGYYYYYYRCDRSIRARSFFRKLLSGLPTSESVLSYLIFHHHLAARARFFPAA